MVSGMGKSITFSRYSNGVITAYFDNNMRKDKRNVLIVGWSLLCKEIIDD
jgi:hypothetical protein